MHSLGPFLLVTRNSSCCSPAQTTLLISLCLEKLYPHSQGGGGEEIPGKVKANSQTQFQGPKLHISTLETQGP